MIPEGEASWQRHLQTPDADRPLLRPDRRLRRPRRGHRRRLPGRREPTRTRAKPARPTTDADEGDADEGADDDAEDPRRSRTSRTPPTTRRGEGDDGRRRAGRCPPERQRQPDRRHQVTTRARDPSAAAAPAGVRCGSQAPSCSTVARSCPASGCRRTTRRSSSPARAPASSCTSGRATTRAWCCAGRSRSTRSTAVAGTLTIHFRTVGRGTEWFTRLRPGDGVDMLGPLGRPFEVDPRTRHVLLVAGGLGIAGVRALADEAIRDGRQVTLLFGGARARDVYPSSLLPDEVEYVVATDDGSRRPPRLRDRARPRVRGLGRPGLRLRAAADAARPRASSQPPGDAGWASPRWAGSAAPGGRSPPARRRRGGRRSSRSRWSRTWAARSGPASAAW